ncbi:uncharacterized protein LOC127788747 [Diospyros lotus]|uniref:uncharacterized protein LOC127788747 n=1 Tax=Diospyros lotus TaxID=55363 RepID=UPI0022580FE7|nr:uncharacterized protein LOC127788747 [Diospyros lotus]
MDEHNTCPSHKNSISVNKVLQSSIAYLNKKRKFQSEQLGLPLSKHQCWDPSFGAEYDPPYNKNLIVQDFSVHAMKDKIIAGASDDGSEQLSAKDSNSFGGDTDSSTSESCEVKTQSEYPKAYPSDKPSTSSVNWGSSSYINSLYSFDSRSITKLGAEKDQSPYTGRGHNLPHNDFGLHSCLNFDEHLLEVGNHIDSSCLEYGNDIIDQSTDKELEDMLYSNGTAPNNCVLSSGRWNVNQEDQSSTKNLTIDKEFEQYFSMLML